MVFTVDLKVILCMIFIRESAGVDAETGAPQWNAYYYDANANGMMDGSESLSDHCLNMNLKILKMLLVS
jgi:hypothetical protein